MSLQFLEWTAEMSEHVAGLNRYQTALFPDTLEGYVDKENPVRFIDDGARMLDSQRVLSRGRYQSTLR